MTNPQLKDPFTEEFQAICGALGGLARAPRSQAKITSPARADLEKAALTLIGNPDRKEQPKWWLRVAALSLSPALVRAFGPGEPNSLHVVVGGFPWEMIAKQSCPEHLEALHAAGFDMTGAHKELFKRAMTKKGADIHAFLEAHVGTVWNKSTMLDVFSARKIKHHQEFIARYLTAAKAHHYEDLQWWLGTVMRSLTGSEMLLLHCLGVEPKRGEFIPDFAKRAFEGHSAHRQMQIEGWKRDPASLIQNQAALDWAAKDLVRVF